MIDAVSGPAKSEIGCEEIAITVLHASGTPAYLKVVSVSGCGQERTYLRLPPDHQWVQANDIRHSD